MASPLPLNGTTATALERPSFPGYDQVLGELLDAHRRDAHNPAYRLLGRQEDAADAVQDAFLRAVRAMRGEGAAPREPDRFRAWLLRIVSNVAVDQLRQRARATVAPLDEIEQVVAAGDRGQPAYELDRRPTSSIDANSAARSCERCSRCPRASERP
jgi:RNA polymerase sigma-70 factor (ECF subfamily)